MIQNEVDIIRTNAVLSTKYFMLFARIESLIAGESIETVLLRATVGFRINMTEILKGCGFSHVYTAVDETEVKRGSGIFQRAAEISYGYLRTAGLTCRPWQNYGFSAG